MKSAPPVVYPAGRSLLAPLAWALLTPVSLWLWQPWQAMNLQGLTVPGAGALQLVLLGLVVSVSRAHPCALKALHWDGAGWLAEGVDGQWRPVHLQVHADGARFLWLSARAMPTHAQALQAPAATWWLLLQARANPVRWHGFRCAVYCRSQSVTPQSAAQARRPPDPGVGNA